MIPESVARRVVPLSLALVVVVSLGDWLTGVEIGFTLLYLGPIAFATWQRGRTFGAVIALLSALGGAFTQVADLVRDRHAFTRQAVSILAWNQGGALGIFLVVVHLLSTLRRHVDRDRAERDAAVQSLRHSQRLNALGVFAAGVAHELGTPLAVVAGSAELIARDGTTRAGARALATTIGEQVARMESIVRGVLDFGRPQAPRDEVVDLAAVAEEVVALLGPIAARRGCELAYAGPAGGPYVRGDRRELAQVVGNLVTNAVQACGPGPRVQIDLSTAGEEARLAVVDRGTGIAPEDLSRVFDPFFTTKDVHEGSGLGLSVSFGIVRDHGGSIDVASRVGEGSTFVVRLPLLPQDAANAAATIERASERMRARWSSPRKLSA